MIKPSTLWRGLATILPCVYSFLLNIVAANQTAEIQSAARRLRLYPHVIKHIPSDIIEVTYGEHKVKLGETLNSDEITELPQVSWPTKKDMLYVMVLSGPDAKNLNNESNSYEHWIVGNIPGLDLKKGEKLSEYVGLTETAYRPGETHRLIFWVFEQPDGDHIPFEGERIKKEDVGKIREMLALDAFAKHYELGNPIAINFFEVFLNETKT